jgi:hypothetical protein
MEWMKKDISIREKLPISYISPHTCTRLNMQSGGYLGSGVSVHLSSMAPCKLIRGGHGRSVNQSCTAEYIQMSGECPRPSFSRPITNPRATG